MLSYTALKKGVRIILDKEPYEVLQAAPLKKAQRRVVVQSRIRNLITGAVFPRNFHQGDIFEEAELLKFKARFLYAHRDKFVFCKDQDPSQRFELIKGQIGNYARFLKPGQIVEGIIFNGKIVNIILPIKLQLKVIQAPPGIKGDTAQGGVKQVILETGLQLNTPLFIEAGDTIELNTENGEYVRRIQN